MGVLVKVFEFNVAGLNWPRAVMAFDIMLVPLVVFWVIGYEQYLLSAVFGALLAVLADPGGAYGPRVLRTALFALFGAAVTAAAFALGGAAWGWLVLVAFAVTLAAGLAVAFGVHRFVAALLLNLWLLIALTLGVSLHRHTRITNHVWGQVVAWLGGAALWIAVTFVVWLISGRRDAPQPVAELPGDTLPRKLTPPLIIFAAIRAVAIAGTVAIAYGLNLSHADWMPIAALIAMRPDLGQATLMSLQRVAGALIGAVAAILLLLIPANEHGLRLFQSARALEIVAIVLLMHAAAVRFWNYAIYTAAVAAGVLVLENLTQPTDYTAEGERVLWTLAGVGIGILVMLLAALLAKRHPKTQPQAA